jgi:fused-like protein
MVPAVCGILNIPLAHLGGGSNGASSGTGDDREPAAADDANTNGGGASTPIDEETLSRLQSVIYNQLCTRHVIAAIPMLLVAAQQVSSSSSSSSASSSSASSSASHTAALHRFLDAPLALLCRLVLSSNYFVSQFIQYGGLAAVAQSQLLSSALPASALIDVLQTLSQIARVSKDNYAPIAAQCCGDAVEPQDAASSASSSSSSLSSPGAGSKEGHGYLFAALPPLLRHADAHVRAKAANLVGNLTRHSARFYAHLLRHSVLAPLMDCCREVGAAGAAARKFACFAVGNAAFHDASLYAHLRPSVPALVALLGDADEKTRANAAGALGNLARNSDAVVGDICASGALAALVRLTVGSGSLESADAQQSQQQHSQPRKVALFALGNLCNYPTCRQAMRALNCVAALQAAAHQSADAQVQKWLARVIKQLA